MSASPTPDWPADIYRALSGLGIGLAAWVPDAGHARLIELCGADPATRTVALTTEEEGIGLLAGAWLGGVRGVLLMQSSGVGNCLNQFAYARACRFPLLTLVTMRGEANETNPWQVPMGQAAAPAMQALDVEVRRIDDPAEAGATVAAAGQRAFGDDAQVAVLIAQDVIGAKTFQLPAEGAG